MYTHYLKWNHWKPFFLDPFSQGEECKLSPEELALFRNLPVTDLDLSALDLKKDSVEEFSEIIKEMRVKDIVYDEEDFEDFEITVENFSDPAGFFRTIKIEQWKDRAELWITRSIVHVYLWSTNALCVQMLCFVFVDSDTLGPRLNSLNKKLKGLIFLNETFC